MKNGMPENLRFLRENLLEISQQEVAEMLNIERSTYSNYELGKTHPSIPTIVRLCDLFDVCFEELIDPNLIRQFDKQKELKGRPMMLTKSEYQIMNLLWQSDRALSCTEIVELSDEKTWKDSYVHALIKSLMKKGLVKIESFELVTRSYARKFAPKLTYEEYVILSHYSEQELQDTERMSVLIQTILRHTDADALKIMICEKE